MPENLQTAQISIDENIKTLFFLGLKERLSFNLLQKVLYHFESPNKAGDSFLIALIVSLTF